MKPASQPIVKICGIRRPEDAALASQLGARYVGCVLAPDSPRCASLSEVLAVQRSIDDHTDLVLVFRDVDAETIAQACIRTNVSRVQPHGANGQLIDQLSTRGLQVHRVHAVPHDSQALPAIEPMPSVAAPAVLDVGRGGSGHRFDWKLLTGGAPPATLIAGGIGPSNARDLLPYQPFGLDLSSGIEQEPGIKDHTAMRRLFRVLEASR